MLFQIFSVQNFCTIKTTNFINISRAHFQKITITKCDQTATNGDNKVRANDNKKSLSLLLNARGMWEECARQSLEKLRCSAHLSLSHSSAARISSIYGHVVFPLPEKTERWARNEVALLSCSPVSLSHSRWLR